MLLTDVMVPVVLITGVGFFFARFTKLDPAQLTKLAFYVLSPALIFHSMLDPSLSRTTLADVGVFVLIFTTALLLLSSLGVRWAGWDPDSKAAGILSFTFNNCGNYGLPVLLFAFGKPGFTLGVAYMVTHLAYQVVVGVGIASWRKGMSLRPVAVKILTMPWLYALVLAGIVRWIGAELPVALGRPIEMVATAAIPIQLMLLGMSLAHVQVGDLVRKVVPLSLAKLILPPFLAWALTAALGFDGLLRAVLILEASTPSAVNALILSLQYHRRSELTAAVVLLTTLGGVGVSTLLLWILS